MSDIRSAIACLPLFAGLTGKQLDALASACVIRPAERGRMFFLEGEEAQGLFVLISGKVKIFRAGPDGREAVLHVFGPGEPFGEVAVFEGRNFPASAQCVEAGAALFLTRRGLVDAIAADPGLAMNLLATLSRRLRGFAAKVEALTLMETPQRLAAYLLHAGGEHDDADELRLDLGKGLLAGVLGTARETLSRSLSRMVDQGIIEMNGRQVRLLDKEALRRMAEGTENL